MREQAAPERIKLSVIVPLLGSPETNTLEGPGNHDHKNL